MNRNLHRTKPFGINCSQPRRVPAIVFVLICIFVALAATASAQQQQKFNTPIHHSSNANAGGVSAGTANERLPHSVPSSAVSAATARSTASRMELERLERANLGPRPGAVKHTATRSTTRSTSLTTPLAKTRTHSAPINFAYQGPHNGTVGHHNSASQPR